MALDSPNILNYSIFKGVLSIRRTGETNFRRVGNCPEVEWTPNIEKLEHFTAQSGIKTRDRTVVLSKSGTLRIVMEELTAENMGIALLGTVSDDSGGDQTISLFSLSSVTCEVKFEGTNDVGPRYEWYFSNVDIIPSGSVPLVGGDDWTSVEITGEVSLGSGDTFGYVKKIRDGQ